MRIVVTSNGTNLDAAVDPLFGRCLNYIFIDTDTDALEVKPNPAVAAPSGAGIVAAQFVIEEGADAIVSGNVGPNTMDVFEASDVAVYGLSSDVQTVGQALEAFKVSRLKRLAGATVGAHRTPKTEDPGREEKIAALAGRAKELRQELATILDEIEALEKES